jgi:hypothetical protein
MFGGKDSALSYFFPNYGFPVLFVTGEFFWLGFMLVVVVVFCF